MWAGRAGRFARYVAESGDGDPLFARLVARLEQWGGRDVAVLDVGAGPGRHSLPLARLAGRVVAVEPSEAMREQLRANAAGVENLEIVADGWPSAWETHQVERADLVVCSHVAYPVVEVEPFLRALDRAARRACYLALRTDQREAPFLDLFKRIWGEPRALAPTALDLLNVAHQLGLPANLELVPFPVWRGYASLDDAVDQVRQDVLNPPTAEAESIIREHLRGRLVEADGQLALPDLEPPKAGIVWWERSPASAR